LAAEVTQLEKRLFKRAGGQDARIPWKGDALYRELARWRKKALRTKNATSSDERILEPLNPN
jgi:hypothetical protein